MWFTSTALVQVRRIKGVRGAAILVVVDTTPEAAIKHSVFFCQLWYSTKTPGKKHLLAAQRASPRIPVKTGRVKKGLYSGRCPAPMFTCAGDDVCMKKMSKHRCAPHASKRTWNPPLPEGRLRHFSVARKGTVMYCSCRPRRNSKYQLLYVMHGKSFEHSLVHDPPMKWHDPPGTLDRRS